MGNKAKLASRTANVAMGALSVAVIVIALMLVAGRPLGFHAFAVQSGSMEPAYSTGDLIYVKEVEPSSIVEGDVITYLVSDNSVVTHRVIEVVQDAEDPNTIGFRTQGDANDTPDGGIVHQDNLIGTPVLSVPVVGYLAAFVQTPPGTYIALAVCAIIVFLVFLPDLFSKEEDEKEQEASQGTTAAAQGRHATASARHAAPDAAPFAGAPIGYTPTAFPASGQPMPHMPGSYQNAIPQSHASRNASYGQHAAGSPRPYHNVRTHQPVNPAHPSYPAASHQVVAAASTHGNRQVRPTAPANVAHAAHRMQHSGAAPMNRANPQMPRHASAHSGANNPRFANTQVCPSAANARSNAQPSARPTAAKANSAASNYHSRGGNSA